MRNDGAGGAMQRRHDQYGTLKSREPRERRGAGLSAQARIGIAIGVFVCGNALLLLGGGFPPRAWKLLFSVLSGPGHATVPLGLILIQSMVFVIAWLLLVLVATQVFRLGQPHPAVVMDDEETGRGEDKDATTRSALLSPSEQSRSWQQRAEVVEREPEIWQSAPETPNGQGILQRSTSVSTSFPEFPSETGEGLHAQSPVQVNAPPLSSPSSRMGVETRSKMGLTMHIDSAREASALDAEARETDRSSSKRRATVEKPIPGLFSMFNESSRGDGTQNTFHLAPDDFLPPESRTGLTFTGWSLCHSGKGGVLEPLEDSVFVSAGTRIQQLPPIPFTFFLLADGVATPSGPASGLLVSRVLAEALLSVLWGTDTLDQEGVKNLLTHGIQYANNVLYQQNQQHRTTAIATLCAVLVLGGTAYIANVGDNRVYLYRAQEGLVQITFDHSSTEQQLEQGKITPEQVFTLPKESQVYRTLGQQATTSVDVFALALKTEDLLLMCTDGVWKLIRKTTLQQVVEQLAGPSHANLSLLCPTLVRQALVGGGYDRASALVVQARSSSK